MVIFLLILIAITLIFGSDVGCLVLIISLVGILIVGAIALIVNSPAILYIAIILLIFFSILTHFKKIKKEKLHTIKNQNEKKFLWEEHKILGLLLIVGIAGVLILIPVVIMTVATYHPPVNNGTIVSPTPNF